MYCAASEAAQAEAFDSFLAIADFLSSDQASSVRSFSPVAIWTRLSSYAASRGAVLLPADYLPFRYWEDLVFPAGAFSSAPAAFFRASSSCSSSGPDQTTLPSSSRMSKLRRTLVFFNSAALLKALSLLR